MPRFFACDASWVVFLPACDASWVVFLPISELAARCTSLLDLALADWTCSLLLSRRLRKVLLLMPNANFSVNWHVPGWTRRAQQGETARYRLRLP